MSETATLEVYEPVAPPLHVPGNAGVPHLTEADIIDILRWNAQGLTQEEIANRFNPPRTQATISRTLQKYGQDSRPEAKRILDAGAAPAALKILREGRARDLLTVLQGRDVLTSEQVGGMTIIVGSESQVQINVGLSPMENSVVGEGVQKR